MSFCSQAAWDFDQGRVIFETSEHLRCPHLTVSRCEAIGNLCSSSAYTPERMVNLGNVKDLAASEGQIVLPHRMPFDMLLRLLDLRLVPVSLQQCRDDNLELTNTVRHLSAVGFSSALVLTCLARRPEKEGAIDVRPLRGVNSTVESRAEFTDRKEVKSG